MAVNKVIYNTSNGEQILVDLTNDSVTPETLAKGITAHNASGEIITGNADLTNNDVLPEYWENYLPSKISSIKSLHDNGGKDCFSFVVMTDMHYPSNLGKVSPKLSKRILDKCDIKYALCLGDTQTRGCHSTKELLLAENEAIEEMLAPIRNRLLQTEGNHDGAYGMLDKDGNGISNKNTDGTEKEPNARETYVNNLTPAELHSAIYRKVGLVGDVHFDESGSGYYIDDTANKVRYIVLNTQCNDYELQADGTVKYPKMWLFRFTQPQFDLVIDALNNIPSDSWGVVVAGHCPLYQEIGDGAVMQGVLTAYKNKTIYSGEYAGTASGIAYKNLAEPLPNNTTDTSKWVNGYRFSSSAISAQAGTTLSNLIPCTNGDIIRVKGVTLRDGADRFSIYGSTFTEYSVSYCNTDLLFGGKPVVKYEGLSDGVYSYRIGTEVADIVTGFRFSMPTPADASKVIITVNEPIVEGESVEGYDAVTVNCDFTNAKGELVGYFAGHTHVDGVNNNNGFNVITTRCDAKEENTDALQKERVAGTITEQSFDVFTVNKSERKIYATKIGAGSDREISY